MIFNIFIIVISVQSFSSFFFSFNGKSLQLVSLVVIADEKIWEYIFPTKRNSIVVADVETQATLKQRKQHFANLSTLCYVSCSDPNLVIAGYADGHLKMFDVRSHNAELAFIGHYSNITYIDPINDGNHVLSSSSAEIVKIWDIRQSNTRWDRLSIHCTALPSVMSYYGYCTSNPYFCAKFSPKEQTGQRFICIIIYDALTGKTQASICGQHPLIRSMDWHPVRPEIVSGSLVLTVVLVLLLMLMLMLTLMLMLGLLHSS
ncbi:GH24732 [Drosophila grimshawi]|uniref:GH24732 n=1 Tax=Drosophila grimshawi TaxID=7222 RepID=B4JN18_DROGR|nr:GH24732 [Drosophila grimshawi]